MKQYYYRKNGVEKPAITLEEVINKINTGKIKPKTEIRIGENGEWKKAKSMDLLKPHFDSISKNKSSKKKDNKEKDEPPIIIKVLEVMFYSSSYISWFIFGIALITMFMPVIKGNPALGDQFLDSLFSDEVKSSFIYIFNRPFEGHQIFGYSLIELIGYTVSTLVLAPIITSFVALFVSFSDNIGGFILSIFIALVSVFISFVVFFQLNNSLELSAGIGHYFWGLLGLWGISITIDIVFNFLSEEYYWKESKKYIAQIVIIPLLVTFYYLW